MLCAFAAAAGEFGDATAAAKVVLGYAVAAAGGAHADAPEAEEAAAEEA